MEGLLITAGLTLFAANTLDLTSIWMLGSVGFLLVFATVNIANALQASRTNSRWWVSAAGAADRVVPLGALIWQTATTAPSKLWVLVVLVLLALVIEHKEHARQQDPARLNRFARHG